MIFLKQPHIRCERSLALCALFPCLHANQKTKMVCCMKKRFQRRELMQSLLQSSAAALFIFFNFHFASSFGDGLMVASLGASSFIAFVFCRAESSRPRYLIGGYCCAAVVGVLFSFLYRHVHLPVSKLFAVCSLGAVFCVIFFMAMLDFEHPPSVALCISIVLADNAIQLSVIAIISVCTLALCRHLFIRLMDKLNL